MPILDELFGERWLKTGSISMYYTYATTDREDVRAIVKRPPASATDVQLDAWVETLPQPRMIAMEATIFTGWIYDHLLPHAEAVKVRIR